MLDTSPRPTALKFVSRLRCPENSLYNSIKLGKKNNILTWEKFKSVTTGKQTEIIEVYNAQSRGTAVAHTVPPRATDLAAQCKSLMYGITWQCIIIQSVSTSVMIPERRWALSQKDYNIWFATHFWKSSPLYFKTWFILQSWNYKQITVQSNFLSHAVEVYVMMQETSVN
jgi:hypothetical protein